MAKKLLLFIFLIISLVSSAADANRKFTLCIDPGHGGKDTGAPGSKSVEKNINLSVALAFGRYVERNCPDVTVVYTRKTDVFIPLYERAEIANRKKADLFISVHTNALKGNHSMRGFETYTLGDGRSHAKKENLEVAKRENSVILLEKDYQQHYVGFDPNSPESNIMFEFIQDKNLTRSIEFAKMLQTHVCRAANRPNKGVHQQNLAVLRLTSMPACLIELGYISTPEEERMLNDKAQVDNMARGIYNENMRPKTRTNANESPNFLDASPLQDIDSQLNPHLTFRWLSKR
jgi:N-acetylmuramoyl-L-alanine amidase